MLVSLRWTPDMIRNTQHYFLYFLHRYVDMFSFYSSHLTQFSWRRASFLDASFISVNHPLSMSRLAFSLCCLLVSMKKCESQKNVKVKYFWNLSHPILSLWVSADSVKAMFSFFIFLYFQSVYIIIWHSKQTWEFSWSSSKSLRFSLEAAASWGKFSPQRSETKVSVQWLQKSDDCHDDLAKMGWLAIWSPPSDLCCCWIPLSSLSLSLSWGTACSLYSHWCVNTQHNIHFDWDLSARFTWREERQRWKFPSSGSWWAGSGEALECRRRKGQKRASCPLQRRTGGRWIEMDRRTACGPLVGGIHCTAAAFWDTASAVLLLHSLL